MVDASSFNGREKPVRWFNTTVNSPWFNTLDHPQNIIFGGYYKGIYALVNGKKLPLIESEVCRDLPKAVYFGLETVFPAGPQSCPFRYGKTPAPQSSEAITLERRRFRARKAWREGKN